MGVYRFRNAVLSNVTYGVAGDGSARAFISVDGKSIPHVSSKLYYGRSDAESEE